MNTFRCYCYFVAKHLHLNTPHKMTNLKRHPFSSGPVLENQPGLVVGRPVVHNRFGLGEILRLEECVASVLFDSGIRKIDLRSGKLLPFDHPDGFVFRSVRYRKKTDAEELEVISRAGRYVTEVDIPGFLTFATRGYPVTRIGERAFAYMDNLCSVVIPPALGDIAPDAFEGSPRIAQVKRVTCGTESATLVQDATGLWGVLANPSKKQSAIPRKYEQIRFYAARLSEKQKMPTYYFLVRQDRLWGFLNKAGRRQAPCIYDTLEPCESGDLFEGFAFHQGERSGLLDGKGDMIITEQ